MPLSRNLPRNSHILWMISLIQDTSPEAQTKDEFSEMASELIVNNAIDKITLCVADNLQRFRFMIEYDCTEQEAIEKCQSFATQWHKDNQETVEKLKTTKNLSIMKWDEFLAWPDYEKTVKSVEDLYIKDNKFKRDVDGRVKQEFEKISHRIDIKDPTKCTELLKKYLFEESAFQKFAASKSFRFELYKNPLPPAAKRIVNNSDFVPPGYLSDLHFTQFNSQPKKHIYPQNNIIQLHDHENGKHAFSSVLSQSKSSQHHEKQRDSSPTKSHTNKTAEFIAAVFELLPPEEQENASKKLLEFTTQQIMPLCYKQATPIKTQ